jgi:hypothetical protein
VSKDVFGNFLTVGDKVALIRPRYSYMTLGEVTNVTPTGATVKYLTYGNRTAKTFRDSSQLAKDMSQTLPCE